MSAINTTAAATTERPVTPNQPITQKEADISCKKRFLTLSDYRPAETTKKSIFESLHVPKNTNLLQYLYSCHYTN